MARKRAGRTNFFIRFKWHLLGGTAGTLILMVGLLFFLAPNCHMGRGFKTLQDLQSYAQYVPEFPKMDNTNMVRPDYTSFHRTQIKSWFAQKVRCMLLLLGLARMPVWTPAYFGKLLERSVTHYTAKKMRKNIVAKITPTPGTQLVIWGDALGAYHSLVHDLTHLQKLGIINDDLRIVTDNTYLVFMGDVISRSPFGMETLSLVLRLLEVNPKKVLYLRGNHEDNKYWHAFGLKEQLEARAADLHNDAFVSMVDDLFMQLPLGLYLPVPGSKGHYARFSHLGRNKSTKLKEERFAHFLGATQIEPIDGHQFDKSVIHNGKVAIDAIVRSEKKRHSFQTMDGIRLLEPDQGSTAWTVLSSPTRVQQEGLKFYHDAFAIVTVGEHAGQWSITLHAQDARERKGFYQRSYQFFTGKQMTLEEIALESADSSQSTAQAEQSSSTAAAPATTPTAPVVTAPPVAPQPAYRTVLRRVVEQPVPPAPPVIASPKEEKTVSISPQGNQAVSVTVTPPVAGADDQSTIVSVSVKVPPKQEGSSASIKPDITGTVPTVTPVLPHGESSDDHRAKATGLSNTAARMDVLDQVEGS